MDMVEALVVSQPIPFKEKPDVDRQEAVTDFVTKMLIKDRKVINQVNKDSISLKGMYAVWKLLEVESHTNAYV